MSKNDRTHHQVFALVLTAALAMAEPLPVFAQESHQFSVETSDAARAIQQFGTQSGLQILASAEQLQGKHLQQVSGTLSTEEGLKALLAGTGLTHRYVGDRTVALVKEGESATKPVGKAEATGFWDRFRVAQADAQGQSARATAATGDSRDQLEEILVTATKRVESVQDIPVSIAVITGQDIDRRGLIGMEDYLRSIPGVNQIDNGPLSNAIVIRGITTSPQAENYGSGTTVASYFDETPITAAAGMAAGGIDVRPVDIERIEVLRGPQGTAFGSASLGGTLRIIPVKPKLDAFGARLAATYSDTSQLGGGNSMLQGVVNIPLITDTLAVRAVAYRYDESGYYRNIAGNDPAKLAIFEPFGLGNLVRGYTQHDVGAIVTNGGRLSALWKPTDQLSLSLNFLTQKIEQDGAPQASSGKYAQSVAPISAQAQVRGEAGEIADTKIDLTNLVLNYDLGWSELTSTVSWVDGGSVTARDLSSVFGIPATTTNPSDFKSFTAETRLASHLAGRFQFLGGLYYENVDDDFFQTLDWPGTPATSPFVTNPMATFDITRKLEQRAVFGEFSYKLTDTLTATVGGRYFDYDKDERNLTEGGLVGVPTGTGTTQVLKSSEGHSNFKGNLSYQPTKDALLYASWAQGFRLGRPAPGLPSTTCDIDQDGLLDDTGVSIESTRRIDSDLLENSEIGAKLSLFDRRMVLDTSIYHIKWEGLPVFAVAAACNLTYTANAGAATSDGVELQASVFVMPGFKVDFGGSYTKAELSRDALAQGWHDGDRLPGSPRVNANLAAQYDFELAGRPAFVRADSFYTGKFYGDLLQTPGTLAGDYVKIDARAGVVFGSLSAELFVRNLTNEDAFTWRASPYTDFSGYRLRPRTIGIQLGYRFE